MVQEVLQRRGGSWRWTPQWPATRSWQQAVERIIEADPVTTTQEDAKELNVNHGIVIWHLKQTGQVKKLNKWVLHELTTRQKNHFKVKSSRILCKNNEQFFHWIVMCNKKWILYDGWWWPTQCWTEKMLQSTSQSQTFTQRRLWSLFGGLLPVSSATTFWILAQSLHLISVLSKSMRCTEIFNNYSQH